MNGAEGVCFDNEWLHPDYARPWKFLHETTRRRPISSWQQQRWPSVSGSRSRPSHSINLIRQDFTPLFPPFLASWEAMMAGASPNPKITQAAWRRSSDA
jgi:hypothetical protein